MASKIDERAVLANFPGGDLVYQGLHNLRNGEITEAALLLLVASPRLRGLGFTIPEFPVARPYEHQLYSLLEGQRGCGAHSYYNSLLRRIVSFARAWQVSLE